MIDRPTIAFLNGYTYVRKHPQLLMTLLLIVVIPVAFVLSGQQFLKASRDNQETLEKERIGMLHDVFSSFFYATSFDMPKAQTEILGIAAQNPDITQFLIAQEEGDSIVVRASLREEEIGTPVPDTSALRFGIIDPGNTYSIQEARNGVRYWKSTRVLEAPDGAEYYLLTETSLADIDTLFANRILEAYLWLMGILAVVMILVVRHVRLIDYAYLYNETKRANEMKDLFTNMIAHELRAPLTAMRGYASMIRERGDISDEVRTHAQRIEDAAERLVLIVNDLLDVARIRSGKLAIKKERADVQKIIVSVLDTLQVSAREKNIALTQEKALQSLVISIDSKRFHQALTNLVSNSIKYTKAGSITVALEELSDRIELRVKDTGMGISAEDQKHLFAPFFRVENTEVQATLGTGLGMWITKQLIELMGGSIAVESIRGVGTHIVVTLPK